LKTKLTLTIDKSIIQRAKLFAKNTGRSLSEIIEHYLDITTQDNGTETISPKLKKILCAVKLPKNFDAEKKLRSYLEKKHI